MGAFAAAPFFKRLAGRLLAGVLLFAPTCALAEPLHLTVASAIAVSDNAGAAAVRVVLSEPSTAAFADFTKAHIGETIEIRVNGKVVFSPRLIDPILGGTAEISGHFSRDEAEQMAHRLRSGDASMQVEAAP